MPLEKCTLLPLMFSKKIGDITWTVVEGTGKVFCTVFNCTTAARVKNAVISGWSNF